MCFSGWRVVNTVVCYSVRVVPGRGCGTVNPIRKLDVDALPEKLPSSSEVGCGTVRTAGELAKVMRKVEVVRCAEETRAACSSLSCELTISLADKDTRLELGLSRQVKIPS